MKKIKSIKYLSLLFLVILISNCSDNITGFKEAELNQDFDLKVNEQVHIKNTNLLITFNKVTEDSRCPIGLECFIAGRIVVELKLQNPQATVLDTLYDYTEKYFYNYQIKLEKVAPYPIAEKKINPKDYTAKLILTEKEE